MSEISANSPTLLDVVRHWPVASNLAQHLPAGSLINLARSSTSLRGILHGFDTSRIAEAQSDSPSGIGPPSEDATQISRPRKVLYIGSHRTPYWEGLKRSAPFTCSSRTHTKGDKTGSCRYCSMPICESCVVKHSFGKNENTFKNRCRFMCKRCWDSSNVQKQRRYSGRAGAVDEYSHRSAAQARVFCICTSKDGWVCNECKEKQNMDARADGTRVCHGQNCGNILEDDKDRRKICLWCDKPIPRGRASMESRIAFDQKMMDAREREFSSQLADWEEYESNRRRQMLMSRRELRGDAAVEDDPDADMQQFVRNLDILNYYRFCGEQPTGDEIYNSKHGQWQYNAKFLKCFQQRRIGHKDAASLRSATCSDSHDAPLAKTNWDLWMMASRRPWDEPAMDHPLDEGFEARSDTSSDYNPDAIEKPPVAEEQVADAEAHFGDGKACLETDEEPEDGPSIVREIETEDDRKAVVTEARSDESDPGPEAAEVQPGQRPPEYGADTLILESGDAVESE
ncbi:hypothetical protein EPUS_06188 [Endocarpon pusillum Z07020]|uniref:Uncharacterized protein n=1 Tax=Endocarpon pusillum (strain Z07020 / HMAS-L-300199) TaxID=1263415 RepID=U1GS12_ENDPU|nr:uncharacterized protein EPUS_06188 [Endocarpon pusillum Z07020]ERF75148.1 hypothetical protein EPUS_06188 [Endocarpon pusillum Z07020]